MVQDANDPQRMVRARKTLQIIIYFAATVELLYHCGIVQAVLKRIAWLLQFTMGTTATESLNACSCVLLGSAESPLLIRPYLDRMTASELHALMTTGFACIAGSIFAAFISFGACPSYLISAALMASPASLACSKLAYPETEESNVRKVKDLDLPPSEETNPLEAITNGTMMGVHLVIAIIANLVVFMALMALIDGIIKYAGTLVGLEGLSLEVAFAYAFYPIAYLIGVTESPAETFAVAQLLGVKIVVNDFIAYQRLGELLKQGILSPRSAMIATYALCSFSDLIAAGIQLAVLGSMAPKRKQILSKIVFRALITGNISCLMSASLAGVLVDTPVLCRPSGAQMATTCFNLTAHDTLYKQLEAIYPRISQLIFTNSTHMVALSTVTRQTA